MESVVFCITDFENEYFAKYDNAYLEQYDELFMIMYLYLCRYKSIEGYVNLTIKDFILYYNYTPNRNKGRINEKVYDVLQLMIDREFIRFVGCYSNGGLAMLQDVDCNMMFTVQVINFDEKWNPESRFTKILFSEIDSLRSKDIKPLDKVLFLYTHIKKRISSDTDANNAKPFAYPSEETLARECHCGVSTVKKYTDVLCGVGMLYVKNYGSYLRMRKGKEVVTNSNNVYALKEKYITDGAKADLREYLKFNCGYIDGFYPFCDNLPTNASGQWGEPYSDVSLQDLY